MADKTRLTPARRTEYADAAIKAFAQGGGYHGTTLNDIALQAGVTQPRISQVYGNKLDAFLEAHSRAGDVVIGKLRDALGGSFQPDHAMALWTRVGEQERDMLLVIQYATSAAQVPEIGEAARQVVSRIWRLLVEESGATKEQAVDFLSRGVLYQGVIALDMSHNADHDPALTELVTTLGNGG